MSWVGAIVQRATFVLSLAAASCAAQTAPAGEPGSVVVHMGGSMGFYGASSSASH